MSKSDGKQDLAIQKLQIQFTDHSKNDEKALKAIHETLKSIDSKIDRFTSTIASVQTQLAVNTTNFTNHVKNHEQSKMHLGIILTVATIVINIVTFVIQHVVFK
jgi:predicted  nucleic acid-binding Zn-ribbon protein